MVPYRRNTTMLRRRAARVSPVVAVLAFGCGEGTSVTAPTAPTPRPAPSPPPAPQTISITGTITNTVTGATVGSFTSSTTSLPAKVTVAAPGYVSRETWVSTVTPRVDLFPEAGFDLAFYRQLARASLDNPLRPLDVLPEPPAFYMEVEGANGLSRQTADRLEAVARRVVPLLTGGRFTVTRWETGPTARAPQPGWIMIERRDDPAACGRARLGARDGRVWLSADRACDRIEAIFAHELGHAFGFSHVDRQGSMMDARDRWWLLSAADAPSALELHHMRLAYARRRGNTDVDADPQQPVSWQTARVVD